MVRTICQSLFVALVVLFAGSPLSAQSPNLPAVPVPVAPTPGQPQPQPMLPAPSAVPPPGQGGIFLNDPTPAAQQGRGFFDPAGVYASLEISLLFPELRGFLSGPTTVLGVPQPVVLPSANLESTGSPKVELGYRLGDGWGAVALSYRSIVSQGGANIPHFDILGDGFLNTRLNVNVVDLDYVSPGYEFFTLWAFAFRGGVRGAAAYFDHQVSGAFATQSASSNFLGIGPHATLELARACEFLPGLAVVATLDGAVLIGNTTQSFEETVTFPGGQTFGGASRSSSTQTVPVLTFDVGLSYTPPGCPHWARFGVGYQFEYWWDIGTHGGSRTDLGVNGVYFRGEFNF
jgi:hypothetical protein